MNTLLFNIKKDRYILRPGSKEYTHVVRVLRSQEGDILRIACKDMHVGKGSITRKDPSGIEITAEWEEAAVMQQLPIDVLLGHPRPIVARRLIKDLTTIGIRNLHIVHSDLGEKSYRHSKIWLPDNLDSYQNEGVMQAGIPGFLGIVCHNSLNAFLDAEAPDMRTPYKNHYETLVYTCKDAAQSRLPSDLEAPVLVCIGSERGWSESETKLIETYATQSFSFGPRTLRTETACIGAVLLVSHCLA